MAAQVEQFWRVYSFQLRPERLDSGDYHFFRAGIKPVWEVRRPFQQRTSHTQGSALICVVSVRLSLSLSLCVCVCLCVYVCVS
jgi:hypothetical protein